jgi:transcriptional regulator
MYRPPYSRLDDEALAYAIMRAHPFATLVTMPAAGDEPFVSHLPFLVEPGALVAHMARANPQWRHFDGRPVKVVFSGSHAYVSPRWYAAPAEQVPTWNYVAVHATGIPELLDGAGTLDALDRLVAQEEAAFTDPWRAEPALRGELAKAIVAFRIRLTRVEGKLKLSQNRDPEDARRVREALLERAPDVAAWMGRVQGE